MDLLTSFHLAVSLLFSGDADLYEIIFLSLRVSLTSVSAALCIGVPLGAFLASIVFPGRAAVIILINTLLSMPPVVIGLLVYMLISRAGPFGFLDLLYSPTAMIIAQFLLIVPLSTALSRQLFEHLHHEYNPLFSSLRLSLWRRIIALLIDAKLSLVTIGLVSFGRAISEVGAVILVGGNIKHATRVMTSAIALETSRGELAFALALGIVLLIIALGVNLLSAALRARMDKADINV